MTMHNMSTDEERIERYWNTQGLDEVGKRALRDLLAEVREDERRACIAYADRTERMYLARAQAIADDTDRADGEAAADDQERHEMRAEGARAVAHGLRKAAHR